MRGFLEVFRLEIAALVRSKTVAMLSIASLAWMFAMPFVVTGDGTVEGERELFIHYSLGGVFALLLVALVASATGVLARERTAKRLQLTMVRPVRFFSIAFAKTAALTACGAAVLALATLVLAVRTDLAKPCSHVLKPVMPSPREEAKAMYRSFMEDPNTPAQVKSARKSAVLRLLENRAMDNYQTIGTNDTAEWKFNIPGETAAAAVRIRFTNQFDMRDDVRGLFRLGGLVGVASNITQAIVTVPLLGAEQSSQETAGDPSTAEANQASLRFENRGKRPLMLRPRRDIDLLQPADAFGWNLLRTYLELVSILALTISFGVFLSAALGRPVALFTAIVSLLVGEMSPSVVEQYPDELEKDAVDRIGLVLTRFAAEATRPVSALNPLERLASDACVERKEVARVVVLQLLLVPVFLSLLAAFALPRKQDDL